MSKRFTKRDIYVLTFAIEGYKKAKRGIALDAERLGVPEKEWLAAVERVHNKLWARLAERD